MTCMWTSPWIWFAVDATVRDFRECFEKSLYGCNLLLTIQNLSLLPRDIGFSTNEGFVLYANVQKVLNVRVRRYVVCVCVCVGGGNVLASGERGFQE